MILRRTNEVTMKKVSFGIPIKNQKQNRPGEEAAFEVKRTSDRAGAIEAARHVATPRALNRPLRALRPRLRALNIKHQSVI
jgi:hypothetical protein